MATRRSRPDEQEYDLLEQSPIRKAIGDRTLQSVAEKPSFWMTAQVDCTALVLVRGEMKQAAPEVLPTYNDFIIKAVAAILRDNPRFNAWRAEDGLHVLRHVNVGFAVATEQGVMLPTVLDADEKSLTEVATETKSMVEMARKGRLRASLQMGAGFTVSNIGPGDVDAFSAIISPPQTGILSFGAMKPRPVVDGEQVVIRQTMSCTLSIDHAAADGADGAKLLSDVKAKLEDESFLRSLAAGQA